MSKSWEAEYEVNEGGSLERRLWAMRGLGLYGLLAWGTSRIRTLWFAINFTEIVPNSFMMPTGIPAWSLFSLPCWYNQFLIVKGGRGKRKIGYGRSCVCLESVTCVHKTDNELASSSGQWEQEGDTGASRVDTGRSVKAVLSDDWRSALGADRGWGKNTFCMGTKMSVS